MANVLPDFKMTSPEEHLRQLFYTENNVGQQQ